MKKSLVLLISCSLAAGASSCKDFGARLRKYTYPPTFHYITNEQLKSTMWQLAYHSRELRVLMASPEETAINRPEVLQHLRAMEQVMIDLNRTGWPTNHPMVDANRSSFLQDIRTAQDAVSREPPNFFQAGAVSGACAYCHGSR